MKMKLRRAELWLCILAMPLAITLAAQSPIIPFHVKLQRTQKVFDPDGTLEAEQIIYEDYMRNSEGSAYAESKVLDSM